MSTWEVSWLLVVWIGACGGLLAGWVRRQVTDLGRLVDQNDRRMARAEDRLVELPELYLTRVEWDAHLEAQAEREAGEDW